MRGDRAPSLHLPAPRATEREALLDLLRRDGILYRSETQPVLSRDGTSARWMLDSLKVTLTPRGAELAGQCLLQLLEQFQGRQLATYGTTGIPLLQSCVLQSNGRYRGLLVRKERKPHGSRKLIEGPIDPSEPVVIVDDSVSSGLSVTECASRLEEAGLWVEGGVCLVRFGWNGGFSRMAGTGYRMAAVFDIWDDFINHMPDEEPIPANPSRVIPPFEWSPKRAAEGRHPASLMREVIAECLRSGKLLLPPRRLDRPYDGAGGVWVSVRARENLHHRHARGGFWHFPGEERGPLPHELTLSAYLTARELAQKEADPAAALGASAIAVTFFSALEECSAGELDNDRYGIVVRSRERPSWMGGALPRMPGIEGEWHQLHHARIRNAGLDPCEPYAIFRHEVYKVVEPGAAWQKTGVPLGNSLAWHDDPAVCGAVSLRARALVLSRLGAKLDSAPLPEGLLPKSVDSLYVSIYSGGRLSGCMGGTVREPERDLERLCAAAVDDPRFGKAAGADPQALAVAVAFLHEPLEMGEASPEEAVYPVRHAEQALMAYQGERVGLLLPHVAISSNLGPADYARAVLEKAGISQPPYRWVRFDCQSWLCDEGGPRKLDRLWVPGEPPRSADAGVAKLAPLLAGYLLKHQRPHGEPFGHYDPFADVLTPGLEPPRLAHLAWTLERAHRRLKDPALSKTARAVGGRLAGTLKDAEDGLWLETEEETISELSFLLLAHCDGLKALLREQAKRLAATLWSRIDAHGRLRTHRNPALGHDAFQDYYPGQALLALARAAGSGLCEVDQPAIDRAWRFYRHRFGVRHSWGSASWLLQACEAWHRLTRDDRLASLAEEICSFALWHQQAAGGFINDHQRDSPGFTTALYLEGIAAAAMLARDRRDRSLRRRCLDSCERGLRFVDRLVYQERDFPLLPNPDWALGGVKASLVSAEVRLDFVQHTLLAVLGIGEALQER